MGDLMRRLFERLGNPILIVDMKSRLRRPRFIIAYTVTMALVALTVIFTGLVVDSGDVEAATVGKILFLTNLCAMGGVLLLIFPAFSCTTITEERVKKSFDLLITADLSPWRIVLGKLLSCLLYCGLFIVGTLPLVSVAFLYGGVSIAMILIAYYDFIMLAAVISAFGIVCSAGSKSSNILAIIRTYAGLVPFTGAFIVPIHMVGIYTLTALEMLPLSRPVAFFINASTGTKALLIALHPVVFLLLINQFLCFSVNALTPQNLNRSGRMRVCYLLWLAALLVFIIGIPLCEGKAVDFPESWWITFLAAVLLVGGVHVFLFASELRGLSRRLRRDIGRLRGIGRIRAWLFPGGDSGLLFAMLGMVGCLLVGCTALAIAAPLPSGGFVGAYASIAVYMVTFLFCAGAMTRVLCELIGTRVAALIVVLILALTSVIPPVLELSTEDTRLSFLSPYDVTVGIARSAWNGVAAPTSSLFLFERADEKALKQRWERIEVPRLRQRYPLASPSFISEHQAAFLQREYGQWPRVSWVSTAIFGILAVLLVGIDRALGHFED